MKQMMVIAMIAMQGVTSIAANNPEAATADDASRALKKGTHRTEEALCTEGEAKCTEQKIKNRATESDDYMKDKSKELKKDIEVR